MRGLVARLAPLLFIAPALAATILFIYVPMGLTATLSFFEWNVLLGSGAWRGWANYAATFGNIDFLAALWNTALYVLILVPAQMVVPLALAFLLLRLSSLRLVAVLRALFFLPTILSFSIAGVVWLWLFNPIVGLINTAAEGLGLAPQRWLNDPSLALWCVSLVAFWKGFGLNLLLYAAALVNVPKELLEAAEIDGASRWRQIRTIQLPLISPTLFFTAVTTVLIVLDEIVGAVDVLTEGGPFNSSSNLLYYLYERAFRNFQFGEASAVAVVIMALVAVITWLQFRVFERHVHYQ